jgi:hypothetical protein
MLEISAHAQNRVSAMGRRFGLSVAPGIEGIEVPVQWNGGIDQVLDRSGHVGIGHTPSVLVLVDGDGAGMIGLPKVERFEVGRISFRTTRPLRRAYAKCSSSEAPSSPESRGV